MLTMTNGDKHEAIKMFANDTRALVYLEPGVPVMVVKTDKGWDAMTGEPARPGEELDAYNALLKDAGTSVDVTDPNGTTTTYQDK